jgi:hypothetical protein
MHPDLSLPNGRMTMIVCLIHWKIRKGMEAQFIAAWQTIYTIKNRDGLIGEYLSEVKADTDHPWITWPIRCANDHNQRQCAHFINVGIWESATRFHEEIADKFNDDRPIAEFEIERRRRVLVQPIHWRTGKPVLPSVDSPGVK